MFQVPNMSESQVLQGSSSCDRYFCVQQGRAFFWIQCTEKNFISYCEHVAFLRDQSTGGPLWWMLPMRERACIWTIWSLTVQILWYMLPLSEGSGTPVGTTIKTLNCTTITVFPLHDFSKIYTNKSWPLVRLINHIPGRDANGLDLGRNHGGSGPISVLIGCWIRIWVMWRVLA